MQRKRLHFAGMFHLLQMLHGLRLQPHRQQDALFALLWLRLVLLH
jgi:hypothetical protein